MPRCCFFSELPYFCLYRFYLSCHHCVVIGFIFTATLVQMLVLLVLLFLLLVWVLFILPPLCGHRFYLYCHTRADTGFARASIFFRYRFYLFCHPCADWTVLRPYKGKKNPDKVKILKKILKTNAFGDPLVPGLIWWPDGAGGNTISKSYRWEESVSSKVEWPLSRFIILLRNCPSDYKFGWGFAAKYCTDLLIKLGPPNFVIEKKKR